MVQAISGFSSSSDALAGGALFDRFCDVRRMDDAMDENAWRMNRVGIDFPGFDEMLDLRHGDLAGCRHHRIEVARRLAINEIAFGIALIGVNNGDIGDKSAFHDIGRAVEFAQFLPLGNECTDTSLCEKRRNTGPACPNSLGERALRVEFEFEFAGEILPLE